MVRGIAAALAVALGAWLIGESLDVLGVIPRMLVLCVLPIVVGVSVFFLWRSASAAAAFAIVTAAAVIGGAKCSAHAFNTCVSQSEKIRDSIEWYKRDHGHYPATLRDAFLDQPCQRCIRGTIIRYRSTRVHYVLSFSDSLMTWETNDRSPWRVSK